MEKKYFTIGEVSKICELEQSVIRYWQKEFKQLNPKITNKQRRYQQKDIVVIKRIKFLLYDEKLTTQGAIKKLNTKLNNIDNKPVINEASIIEIKTEIKDILKIIKQN